MDKRYQVFLSSTYADLREERRKVIQTLMEMDCIPAGMELFPAADEEQWEFIKHVINDCDYYVLIIGGRYGSLTPDGISYTEREFDYACSRGLHVLAFIHEDPDDLAVARSDIDPLLRERLAAFRERVKTGRLVRFWNSAEQLPGLVALSLSKTIKAYPAVGWVRTSAASSSQLLEEVNELRKANAALVAELEAARGSAAIEPRPDELAPLDAKVTVAGTIQQMRGGRQTWRVTLTWKELFALLAPHLLEHPNDSAVRSILTGRLVAKTGHVGISPAIEDEIYQTIKVQFLAHGLVRVDYLKTTQGGMALFWSLTTRGSEVMMSLRAVRAVE
jgi:hypothetical protein